MTGLRSALLTGASGFIGRVLHRQLVAGGVTVTCLARPGSAVDAGDLVHTAQWDARGLRAVVGGRRFDAVFHLAAAGVAPGDRDPATLFDANVATTAALVDATRGSGVFVYAGSCAEYSAGTEGPIGEDSAIAGAELYGASKAAGGVWGAALARDVGLPFVWLRCFNVYGPGEAPHRLLPSVAARLTRGERVPLTRGVQLRDLLHVDDAARGFITAAAAGVASGPGIYNLCSGVAISVRHVAERIAALLGRPAALLDFGALPLRHGEPISLVGDPSRFAAATGFAPAFDLDAGLAHALEQGWARA